MAFTPVPLYNDNDVNDLERVNAIISNLNYLNESKVTMKYNAYGTVKTDNMKIAAGVIDVNNPNSYRRTRWISVGSFFTPGTRPVVVAQLASTHRKYSTISIARRTGGTPVLDHTGFQSHVRHVDRAKLTAPNYINWIAVGY